MYVRRTYRVSLLSSGIISVLWEAFAGWLLEFELLAVRVLERVGQGVECQIASQSHCNHKVRRSDEGVGGWVGIISALSKVSSVDLHKEKKAACREVPIITADNRVGFALLDVATVCE